MNESQKISFADNSVASVYDNILVPVLFESWAAQLIKDYGPWEGKEVLDLATGSGIFAQLAAGQVGPNGAVLGVDISTEMLALAKERCADLSSVVKFIESPAYPLEVRGESIDFAVCQQGFQFFPDKDAAAREIHRVLRSGGQVVISTWRPVDECEFFGAICSALNTIGEPGIEDMMRRPFDFMPDSQLSEHFESAGFDNVQLRHREQDLVMEGGVTQAVEVAYATPIRPKLLALSDEKKDQFRKALIKILNGISSDGITMGRMVSSVLSAEKQA